MRLWLLVCLLGLTSCSHTSTTPESTFTFEVDGATVGIADNHYEMVYRHPECLVESGEVREVKVLATQKAPHAPTLASSSLVVQLFGLVVDAVGWIFSFG